MLEVDSSLMTAALVFANKQIYYSLLPVVVGPSLWVAGLLFLKLTQLRHDTNQAGKMLDGLSGPKDFANQLNTLDTVIGALATMSVPWRRFRKALVMPKGDSASPVIRTVDSAETFFCGDKTGPAAFSLYHELAVRMTLSFAILFAGCSLASGVFLSVSGLNFEMAGAETQVFGSFNQVFLQSAVAAVTLFILTGVITVVLLQNFCQLVVRSQEKMLHNFSDKLDDLIEPISATVVAFEQTQEVRRQSQYLSIIEKRLTSLESKMIKPVQPNTISTQFHKPGPSSKLSIPPSLRYEITRFRDPLEDQAGEVVADSVKPTLAVRVAGKTGKIDPGLAGLSAKPALPDPDADEAFDITK